MENQSNTRATQNRKRRKEHLDLRKRKKRAIASEEKGNTNAKVSNNVQVNGHADETTKTKATVARKRRKEILQQKNQQSMQEEMMMRSVVRPAARNLAVVHTHQTKIVRYGTLGNQHIGANTAALFYGMRKG